VGAQGAGGRPHWPDLAWRACLAAPPRVSLCSPMEGTAGHVGLAVQRVVRAWIFVLLLSMAFSFLSSLSQNLSRWCLSLSGCKTEDARAAALDGGNLVGWRASLTFSLGWGHGHVVGVVLSELCPVGVGWKSCDTPCHVWVVVSIYREKTFTLDHSRPRWRHPWTSFPS
jgi:hypothetical protein